MSQLAGYEEAEHTEEGGFLVINKESGELCFYQPEDLDKTNINTRIKNIKDALSEKIILKSIYVPNRILNIVVKT